MKKPDKKQGQSLARKRIMTLLEQAAEATQTAADAYVKRIWQIATKNNLRLSTDIKRRFCRSCKSYWRTATVRIRIEKGKKIYTCKVCGAIKRVPLR